MATSNPRFQKIHPNVDPVMKFPTIVTPMVKGVSSTKFLDKGKWISPKKTDATIIPAQMVPLDGVSALLMTCIAAMNKDIRPSRNIISSVMPAEKATRK